MNIREEDFFHVYIHVLVGDIVFTFCARYVGQFDTPPGLPLRATGVGSVATVAAGEGCSYSTLVGGRTAYWLLRPPFTQRESANAIRSSGWGIGCRTWPDVDHYEQDVYTLQDMDVLCTAHLDYQDHRFRPTRFEYVINAVVCIASIRRGSFLVAPSTWIGRAKVLERVSEDIMSSCLECALPSGRIIWVRVGNSNVIMDVGVVGTYFSTFPGTVTMGRLTFGTLLAEERLSYSRDGRATSRSPSYPLSKLAATIAGREYICEGHGQISSSYEEGGSSSSTPGIPARSSGTSLVSGTSSDAQYRDSMRTPILPLTIHFDFHGQRLLEVVTTDFVAFHSSFVTPRHAVIDPSDAEVLRRGQRVLVIGSIHMVLRLVKNHGLTTDRPLCTVIECVVEDDDAQQAVILLAANFLVHRSFVAEEQPNGFFTGTGEGCAVVGVDGLGRNGVVGGISLMYYRSVQTLGLDRYIILLDGYTVSFAVPHEVRYWRQLLPGGVASRVSHCGSSQLAWWPIFNTQKWCSAETVIPTHIERLVRKKIRFSVSGAPYPRWSLEYDGMLVDETALPETLSVGTILGSTLLDIARFPHASAAELRKMGNYVVLDFFTRDLVGRGSVVILPFCSSQKVVVLNATRCGRYDYLLKCASLEGTETVTLRVPDNYVDGLSFTWMGMLSSFLIRSMRSLSVYCCNV
ncbi:hypothetical protein C8R43DRAFT_958618 [Mycena crocata]|nr:hypothetical protein C8R43DRAFT_958618 [Mycena crocata]